MKKIFYGFICLIINALIKSQALSTINSDTAQIIAQKNKLIYITNDDNDNNIHINNSRNNEEELISINDIKKCKRLLSLSDEKFILFGYEDENSKLFFKIYNSESDYSIIQQGSFENVIYNNQINIKMINENQFLLYFFEDNQIYLFKFYIENSSEPNPIFSMKPINIPADFSFNTLECDTFNGEKIMCVYSLISSSDIKFFYVLYKFNDNEIKSIEIKDYSNIRAVSLNKLIINAQQKYIMCFSNYISNSDSSQLYCQTLIEKNNQLYNDISTQIAEKMIYDVTENNYKNNIPIKILIYKYTIYVLIETENKLSDKELFLYSCSLDLGLKINFFHRFGNHYNFTDTKILIDSNENIIVYERISDDKNTKIHYIDLSINCEDFEKQFTPYETDKDITNYFAHSKTYNNYVAFSLDKLTFLKVDNDLISEGLNDEKQINLNTKVNLSYSENLQMTHNYYIIYKKNNNFLIPLSHFCYFKVINCYHTCSECHYNILGNYENHQCKKCSLNHYKFNNGRNDVGYYNCYERNDSHITENMYLENEDEFKYCNESCKECFDRYNCISCSIGYYFKADENNNINENICYSGITEYYYLNTTSNIIHNNRSVNLVYKPCYPTCKTCYGDGSPNNNKCMKCNGSNIVYPFDDRICTYNKDSCETKYWGINETTRSITCLDECKDGYVIKNSTIKDNINQCVSNCKTFFDPFQKYPKLLSFECGGEKTCITVDECKRRGLLYDIDECKPEGDSCYHIPKTTIPEIPPTQPPSQAPIIIENRVRFIKAFEINKEYSELKSNFKNKQLSNYITEYENELSIGIYKEGFDFITYFKYKDFNITIYPLDAEKYVKDNLFDVNNLCYINFTKFFQNYEIPDKSYNKILIALIEYKNQKFPISTINYFFIFAKENDISINGKIVSLDELSLDNKLIDISYPLYNFQNDNIVPQYSTNLISTIKELNNIDENFNFFDQNNKYYSDICYANTFGKDVDISIRDRIDEYYFKISFCENGCSFINIYNKERNPTSLCECLIRDTSSNIEEENYSFEITKKEHNSVSNIKALSCIKEVSKKLGSNPSFWIYFIIIFIHIILFLSIIFCGKKAIENMFKTKKEGKIKLKEENNIINNNKDDIYQNNINDNIPKLVNVKEEELNINKRRSIKNSKNNNSNNKNNDNHSNKESINYVEEKASNSYNESNQENSVAHPPKKKSLSVKKTSRETTSNNKFHLKNDNETSLITSDLFNNKDKDSGFEDIFDDIGNYTTKVNNYVPNEKNIKKDNYIKLHKVKLFLKIKKSLPPIEKHEFNKYKYINTINEIIDNKQNLKLNLNISNFDQIKKGYNSADDIKINNPNLNLINYSEIKNKGIQKISKLFGEESILSGNEKFLQAANIINNSNKNIENTNNNNDDNYEKNIKENNNHNKSVENSYISEKNDTNEINLKMNNLYKNKNKKNSLLKSLNENSENRKLKNSFNASINSNNKLISSKISQKIQEETDNKNIKNKLLEKEENIYNKKSILSSSESVSDPSSIYLPNPKTVNFFYFYCDYFIQREIFLTTFYHKHDNVSLFIRLPTFFISMGFIFTINCLFLTEKEIHRRYEYYIENGKMNEVKYAFKYNMAICFLSGIINAVFKMICIKLVYFLIFKIKKEIKDEFSPFVERNLSQIEMKELNKKKKKYMNKYKKRSIIFMIITFILLIVFAYISICYIGTFPKSIYGVLINFIISIIFSFIICALLCCIVSIFYWKGCNKIFGILKIIY